MWETLSLKKQKKKTNLKYLRFYHRKNPEYLQIT